MNIFQKVYFAFRLEQWFKTEKSEATNMNGTKPGYQTTEFWLNLMTQGAVLWGAIKGYVPPNIAAIVSISGAAIYTVARTVIKAISDVKAVS